MTEQYEQIHQKSGKGKWVVLSTIVVLVIVGILIFSLWPKSDKQLYFQAEKNTYESLADEVKSRFTEELEWQEITREKPIERSVELSGEYQDPDVYGDLFGIEQIINNTNLTMNTQMDIEEEKLYSDLEVDLAGIPFEDFYVYVADESLFISLPFLEDVLQIKGKDMGKFLHGIAPETFDPDQEIDLSIMFEPEESLISEEDRQYLIDHYGKFLYEQFPEDVFSSEKEKIDIDGETKKVQKVEFHLSEDELKSYIIKILEEMNDDDRLKEILEQYFEQSYPSSNEIQTVVEEFFTNLNEVKSEVEKADFPEGLTSTVWIEDDLVVKRHIQFETKNSLDQRIAYEIEGTHKLHGDDQRISYDLTAEQGNDDITLSFLAELSKDGDDIKDHVTLSLDGLEFSYESDETVKDQEKDFSRSFSLSDDDNMMNASLFWEGNATYEEDRMSSNNEFYVNLPDLGIDENTLNIQVGVEGELIKEVETVDDDQTVDIGEMSEEDLEEYFENDVAEQFYNWIQDYFGPMDPFDLGLYDF